MPTVGSLGEYLAPLLWTYGDPVADRASNELLHGIFIDAIQLQVAVLYITFEYTLAIKITDYTVTDCVYKYGKFFLSRRTRSSKCCCFTIFFFS